METKEDKTKQEEGLLTDETITSENSAPDSLVQLKAEETHPDMEDDCTIVSDDPEIELNPPITSVMDDSTDCEVTFSMNSQSTSTEENAGGKNHKDGKTMKPSSRHRKKPRCKKVIWNNKKRRSADSLANLAYLKSIGVNVRKRLCREEAERIEASMQIAMNEEEQAGADNPVESKMVGQRGRAVADSAPEEEVPTKTKYRPWQKVKLKAASNGTTKARGGRRRQSARVNLMPPKRRNAISAALARAKYSGWRKHKLQTSQNVQQDASVAHTVPKSYKWHGSPETTEEGEAGVVPEKIKFRPWGKVKLRAAQEALAAGSTSQSSPGRGSRGRGRGRSRGRDRNRGQSRGQRRNGSSWATLSTPNSSPGVPETTFAAQASRGSRRGSSRARMQSCRRGSMQGSKGGRGGRGGHNKRKHSDDLVRQAGELLSRRKRRQSSVVAAAAVDLTFQDLPQEPPPKRQKREAKQMLSTFRGAGTGPRGRGGYRRGSRSGYNTVKVERINLARPSQALQEQIERLRARGPTVDPSSHYAIPDQPHRQATRNHTGHPGTSSSSQPSTSAACCCHSHQQMGSHPCNGPAGTSTAQSFASVLAKMIDDDISKVKSNQSFVMNMRLDVKRKEDAADPSQDKPSTSGGRRGPRRHNGPFNQPNSTEVKKEPAGCGTKTGGAGCSLEIRSGPGPSRAGNHQDTSASEGASMDTNQTNRTRSGRQGDSQQGMSSGDRSGRAVGGLDILSDVDLCSLLKGRIQANPHLSSSVRDNLVQSLEQTQRILASTSSSKGSTGHSCKSSSMNGSTPPSSGPGFASGSSFFQGCVPKGPSKGNSSQGSSKVDAPSQNFAEDDGPPDIISENSSSASFNLQGTSQEFASRSSASRPMPYIWNNGVPDDAN